MQRARLISLLILVVALLVTSCQVIAPQASPAQPTEQPATQPETESSTDAEQPDTQPETESATDAEQPDTETTTEAEQPVDESPSPTTPQPVALEPAFGGLTFRRPIELGAYPGNRVFVAEQNGQISLVNQDGSQTSEFFKLQVSRDGNEEGLLSLALDPQFEINRHLWVYYSVADGPRRTRLARFTVVNDQVDPATELVILEQEQPFSNHNGGAIRFGGDGMLYLGLGDGGSAGDPQDHGQNRDTLLGTIVRLDVREASPEQPYRIPADNPLVGQSGRDEIWAYGLRNPWRIAFDPTIDQLWAGDVGQGDFEEIDIIEKGGNYGWNIFEADSCFGRAADCEAATGLIAPIAAYGRDDGCSVTGGIIYRGTAVPEITDAYLYSDFCSGILWAINADAPTTPVVVATGAGSVSSFGLDGAGNVYLLQFGGPILKVVSP